MPLLVAALHVIAAVSVAPSGLLSPGIGVYLAPPAFYVWILAVSVVLLRTRANAAAAASGVRQGSMQA
ncbi:MAG TPA: hypothetical protein VGP82_22470 [Ktedonobacterales bacterium]|nr:hypothetical protein [Ktedonobacterales bacterium]